MSSGLTIPPQGPSAPQQAAWAQTYSATASHFQLDSSWQKVKAAIESHLSLLQKQAQVKVKNWLKKLSEETSNVVWKKNRNAYAKLLLEQLRCGKLAEPFHRLPPDGPLPTLPKHAVYAFKPARSSSPPPHRAPLQQQQQQQPQLLQQAPGQQQQRFRSASEALDDYMAGVGCQGGNIVPKRPAPAQHQEVPQQDWDETDDVDAYAAAADDPHRPGCLPGTRMPLRGAEAQRVDQHQLADIAWQPSKFELEAELGACRERQRELEWRVQQAEQQLRQQSHLMRHAWQVADGMEGIGPPLPLLSGAAAEDGSDGLPSRVQQRQQATKADIDALIDKYEQKRRHWRTPAWASASAASRGPPGAAAAGRTTSPLPAGDEQQMLGQLDSFQRQTDAIRRQLGQRTDEALGSPISVASLTFQPGRGLAGGSLTEQLSDLLVGLQERTPLRQQPTGLRGDGLTPTLQAAGAAHLSTSLFDGLPPSPLAMHPAAARPAASYNRHVAHAGHHLQSDLQQQQQDTPAAQPDQQQQALTPAPAGGQLQQSQQAPVQHRSPIGPDVRHTLKSAAAAERNSAQKQQAGTPALQRLKQRHSVAAAAMPGPALQQQQQQAVMPPAASPLPNAAEARPNQLQLQPSHLEPSPAAAAASTGQPAAGLPAADRGPRLSPYLQPPKDSNAALAADVLDFKNRLLNTMQQHEAATPRPLATSTTAALARGATPGSRFRLSELSFEGEALGEVASLGGSQPADASRSRFRLTDLSDAGLSAAELGAGSSGVPSSEFSLDDFERQTELLKQQIEAFRPLQAIV